MFVRAENLDKRTIEDIDKLRQESYQAMLRISQEEFEKKYNRQKEIASKYPDFAFKSITELTQEERQKIINLYYDKQILTVETLGSLALTRWEIRDSVKSLNEQRNAPVNDDKLLDMRNELFPPVEMEDKVEEKIKNDYAQNIYFAIGKSSLLTEDYDKLCEVVKQYQARGLCVKVLVDSKMTEKDNNDKADYLYTQEEKERLINLNNLINENGKGEVRFKECYSVEDGLGNARDFESAWTFKDITRANKAIDNIVEYIKINKLSPFETMVFIHDYIASTFKYKDGSLESCRVIPGAFKNGEIVCSGYASMVKAIIDKLDNKDLSCDIVGCTLYNGGKVISSAEGGHAHNMIHIRDEKYGIDGVYMEDACWDSKRENFPEGRGLAHCLYPVSDLEHFRKLTYVPSTSTDRFSNIIIDQGSKNKVLRARLPRPWMITKYGTQSTPIPIEKYEECLRKVYKLKFNGDIAKTEEKVNSALQSSAFVAKHEFKNGDSCFSTTERYKFKGKGKFSLAEGDGRENTI